MVPKPARIDPCVAGIGTGREAEPPAGPRLFPVPSGLHGLSEWFLINAAGAFSGGTDAAAAAAGTAARPAAPGPAAAGTASGTARSAAGAASGTAAARAALIEDRRAFLHEGDGVKFPVGHDRSAAHHRFQTAGGINLQRPQTPVHIHVHDLAVPGDDDRQKPPARVVDGVLYLGRPAAVKYELHRLYRVQIRRFHGHVDLDRRDVAKALAAGQPHRQRRLTRLRAPRPGGRTADMGVRPRLRGRRQHTRCRRESDQRSHPQPLPHYALSHDLSPPGLISKDGRSAGRSTNSVELTRRSPASVCASSTRYSSARTFFDFTLSTYCGSI